MCAEHIEEPHETFSNRAGMRMVVWWSWRCFLVQALGCPGVLGVKMAGNVQFSKFLGHP